MSEGQEFLKECKEVRDDFTAIAGLYTVDEHLVLRTEIDSLLIMYDQLCERVRLADGNNENSGLHKHVVNCFKTDGEQLIKILGFELDHQYNHDHFHTNRYRKGLLMVEFTYNGFRLETVDLTIDETFCKPITYAELKAITPVLGEIPA